MGTDDQDRYDLDFYAWTLANAALLRQGRLSEIDVQNIAEELEDMGRSTRRALESYLEVLLLHLLKWQHQVPLRGVSWRRSIESSRARMRRILRASPSLAPVLPDLVEEVYPDARRGAATETGLPLDTFPPHCPYPPERLLDDDFWPGAP
jgi:hypothetical protein